MTIAIAKDEAFNFTYKANIDKLKEEGEVVFFSPLRDKELPECEFLYLPGGYPEFFAEALSSNAAIRESIKAYAERGGRIYAECGGFMYLCREIDGKPMCNILPYKATMQNAHLHLGYRSIDINGKQVKGHEFHYSEIKEVESDDIEIRREQYSAKGTKVSTAIYHYKNVIAGYTHWYWAEKGFQLISLL